MNNSIQNNVKLGEIADFRNGLNYTKKDSGTGLKVIGVSDFKDNFYPDYSSLEEVNPEYISISEGQILKENDILFVRSNGNRDLIGRTLLIKDLTEKVSHSGFTIRLRFNTEDINSKYFLYVFKSHQFRKYLANYGGGTNISNINQQILNNIEVPFPDLEVQNQIVSILSSFDDLIENNTRRIEILEEMARRIYREWFVHFRYPCYEKDELVDSGTDEFDVLPDGWGMQVMDEILEHYIGGTWGQEEPEGEENNPAYVIRGTDVPGGRLGNVDDIPLRYHKQSYINSRKLQHGDIVFEVSGGSKDQPVGRAMLITDTFLSELDCDDVVHASFCKLLRSDNNILKPEILYLHIREIYDDRRIMKYQVQSTGISNFKFTFFVENKYMFIPPMELQKKFQEKVSALFKQMFILGKQINRLKETRDLLLPKLISGKIDLEEFTIN